MNGHSSELKYKARPLRKRVRNLDEGSSAWILSFENESTRDFVLDYLVSLHVREDVKFLQPSRFENGSTPLENSSMSTTGLSPMSAIATLRFSMMDITGDLCAVC